MTTDRQPLQSTPTGAFGPRVMLAAIRRSPILVGLTIVAAAAAFAGVWFNLPVPKMTGYTVFQVSVVAPHVLSPLEKQDFHLYRQGQATLVKSRLVLTGAMKDPAVEGSSLLQNRSDKVAALESKLKVDFSLGTEFMRLTLEGDNPDELKQILDAVAQSYLNNAVNKKRNQLRERQEQLQKAEKSLKADVERGKRKIENQIELQETLGTEDGRFYLQNRRSDLHRRHLEAESAIRETEIEIASLAQETAAKTEGDLLVPMLNEHLAADPVARPLFEKRDRLRVDVVETRRRLAPGKAYPALEAMEKELKSLEGECLTHETRIKTELLAAIAKAAEQESRRIRAKFESRLRFWQQLKVRVESELKELNNAGSRAAAGVFDPEGDKAKLLLDRELLSHVQRELTAFQLEGDAPDRVSRLETDVTPGVEGQRRLKYSGMAGLAILVVGLGVVLLREVRNPRAATGKDLSAELGVPLIGVIPSMPALPSGETLNQSQRPFQVALTEAVNTARTLLKHANEAGEPPRVILVASALSGEGKTSLACLLAASLARSGSRTVLIDGDLRRPSVHRLIGVPVGPGLVNVLTDRIEPETVIQQTHVPGLSVLAGGRWSDRVVPALAGPRWAEVVSQLKIQYEYVIVDSSPILPVSDALDLARHVDGVLISALRDVTEVSAVKEAVAQLVAVRARVLGMVMHGEKSPSYYRSRYAYQYQSAAKDPADATDPTAKASTDAKVPADAHAN